MVEKVGFSGRRKQAESPINTDAGALQDGAEMSNDEGRMTNSYLMFRIADRTGG
jgi:hypothetical protein